MKTYIYMYIYDNSSLNSSWNEKCLRQNWREKTRFMFIKVFFWKSCNLYDNVGKCPARQVTDNIIIGRWEDAISCRLAKARIQTHARNMKYLLLFHSNSGYVNAPQCYVVHTLPVLFQMAFSNNIVRMRIITHRSHLLCTPFSGVTVIETLLKVI
jgi:hypothetical protein